MTDLLGGVASAAAGLLGGVADAATSGVGGTVSYVAQAGDTLAGIADAHGVPLATVVDANPALAHLDAPPAGAELTIPVPEGAPLYAPTTPSPPPVAGGPDGAAAAPPTGDAGAASTVTTASGPAAAATDSAAAAGQATAGVTSFAGAAEWRLLAQATPPAVQRDAQPAVGRPGGALATLFAEALRAGGDGRLPPELQAPSAMRLAEALQRLGWTPGAATGAGRPGEVVILMRADGLYAVRLGPDGLPTGSAEAASDDAPETVVVREPGQPPGVDLAAARRPAGDGARAGRRHGAHGGEDASLQQAWLMRVLPSAKAVKSRWGVPAGATVAHGALASDWGRLAPGNDFFGLNAARAAGAAATPVRAPGRQLVPAAFASLADAAEDFGATLRGDARCSDAFRQRDAVSFASALARGGFGGPRYAERIDALVSLNGFAALD